MEQQHILTSGTLLHDSAYRVERYISQGGFGITYLASWIHKGAYRTKEEKVVIKELFISGSCVREGKTVSVQTISKDDFVNFKKRFIEEAEKLAKFDHQGIVKVIDSFEENNTAYFVMDFIEGEQLSDIIKDRGGRLQEQEALGYITQVLAATGEVHKHNLLHRDIKPDNIMITPQGNVVLIDFGSARQFAADNKSLTMTQIVTPGYAAPEQYGERKAGPYTDIYAIGATLYYCLTGQKPMLASDRIDGETMQDQLTAPNIINPAISQGLNDIIIKALQYGFSKRYQSAEEMMDAISKIYSGVQIKTEEKNDNTVILSKPEDTDKTQLQDDKTIIQTQSPVKSVNTDNEKKPRKLSWIIGAAILLVIVVVLIVVFPWNNKEKTKIQKKDTLTSVHDTIDESIAKAKKDSIDKVIAKAKQDSIDKVIAKAKKDSAAAESNSKTGTFKDMRDGKTYKWVKIGNQVWMAQNLAYKTYSGCWAYDGNQSNVATYGYLYNWSTANNVSPKGWHLPSDAEWTQLTDYLGGEEVAGGKLREAGTRHWSSPNAGTTNSSGFTALPGGYRNENGDFDGIGRYGGWWSSTERRAGDVWTICMFFNYSNDRFNYAKGNGFSVRCVRDN